MAKEESLKESKDKLNQSLTSKQDEKRRNSFAHLFNKFENKKIFQNPE